MPDAKSLRPTHLTAVPLDERSADLAAGTYTPAAAEEQTSSLLGGYRSIFERTPAMMHSIDRQGRLVGVSDRWLEVMGYRREEVIGQQSSDFMTAESRRKAVEDVIPAFLVSGSCENIEYQLVTKDGEVRDILLSATAERDQDGDVLHSVAVVVDVTDKKRAERALTESEALYRTILQDQTELICRYRPDGGLTVVNQAFCRYFGKSEAELIGASFTDLFPSQSAAAIQAQIEKLHPELPVTLEHESRTRDGQVAWQEWTHRAIAGPEGRPIEFQSVGRDITPTRRQQTTLRRLHEITASQSLALEEKIDAVLRLGLDHFGLDCGIMSEIAGDAYVVRHAVSDDEEIRPGVVLPLADTYCAYTLQQRGPVAFAHVASSELGRSSAYRQLGLEAYIAAPVQVGGRVRGTLCFSSAQRSARSFGANDLEIIALLAQWIGLQVLTRERQDALQRSNSELEQFAHIASHDLQEPLRTISSFCELLQQRCEGRLEQDTDEFIGFIVEGARRMQGLVKDLLAFSRVGTQSGDPKRLQADDVLAQSLQNLKAALEQHQASVESDPLPVVRGDESQLVQLLQNLIGNALKFRSEAPPRIRVQAQDLGSEWRFAVADNGIGIDARFGERIFQVFQRLHNQEQIEGSGIGLSICKKIVERHNGRIWFESEPGKGSTFFFTLPKSG